MAFTLILSFPLHDDMDKLRLHSEIFFSFPVPVHLNGRYDGNLDGEKRKIDRKSLALFYLLLGIYTERRKMFETRNRCLS